VIRQLLSTELEAAGVSLAELAKQARQIVVFGSRAAGVASPQSDLDVFCVGSGPRILSPRLDLVWTAPGDLESARWLGSELAGHVAAYGQWIEGRQDWKKHVFASPASVQRKEKALADRIAALNRYWKTLAPAYREHFLTLVRRDLQRLELLSSGQPVCPTPTLDSLWSEGANPRERLAELVSRYAFLGAGQSQMLTSHAGECWPAAGRTVHLRAG
jgi:hypothetical protein